MLQAPTPRTSWPITGDAAALLTIVHDQMATVAAQEVLLHAYQANLNTAQAPPPTTASGTGSGTTLTVTAVVGKIMLGDIVTGTGISAAPPNTTIVGQVSGTAGGNGVYTTSQATTAVNAALSFSPGGAPSHWPVPQDAATLMLIVQQQTAVLRTQAALLQHYQDLLTSSQTPPPPTGP